MKERTMTSTRAQRVGRTWGGAVTERTVNEIIDKQRPRCPELRHYDVEWGCTDCPLESWGCIENLTGTDIEAWHRTLRERGIDGLLEVYGIRVWEGR